MTGMSPRTKCASVVAFIIMCGLLLASSPLLSNDQDRAAAQSGAFFRMQCPDLWDAVGRQFAVPMSPGGPSADISMEVAEFAGTAVPPASLNCISGKLTGAHSLYGPVTFYEPTLSLPHFDPRQVAQMNYSLFVSVDSFGQTYISMLFARDNRAVALTFASPTSWTNQFLDVTAYGIWTALGGFPLTGQTASDQSLNSGLWSLLVLPSPLVASESSDYLSTLSTGADENYQPMTPALAAGVSHAAPELLGPPIAQTSGDQTMVPTLVPTYPVQQPTCVPNQATTNCSLTPLGVLQGRQTQTAEAQATQRYGPLSPQDTYQTATAEARP